MTPRQLAIALGIASSLALTGLTAYDVYALRTSADREAGKNLYNYSVSLASQASTILESRNAVVRSVAHRLIGGSLTLPSPDANVLLPRLVSHSDVDGLFVYDPAGRMLSAVTCPPALAARLQSPCTSVTNDPAGSQAPPATVSSPEKGLLFAGSSADFPSRISISEGIFGLGGHYQWLLTTWVDFSSFDRVARAVTSANGNQIVLMTRDGVVLRAFPDALGSTRPIPARDIEFVTHHGQVTTPFHDAEDPAPSTKVILPVPGTALLLRGSITDAAVAARWHHAALLSAGFAGALLALIWLLVFYAVRKISIVEEVTALAHRSFLKSTEILSRLRDAVITTDFNGHILYSNVAAVSLLGRKVGCVDGRNLVQPLLPSSLRAQFSRLLDNPADFRNRTTTWDGEIEAPTGRTVEAEAVSFVTGASESSDVAVVTIHDATDQRLYERRLQDAGTVDPLTRLPNMPAFVARWSHELSDTEKCHGLLAVDVSPDRGTSSSELRLLVAERLRVVSRDSDPIASNEHGVLFLFFREVVEPLDLASLARRVRAAYEAPFLIGGITTSVNVRIGIGCYPFDGLTADDLVEKANDAARTAGEDGIRFANPVISRQFQKLRGRASLLREAIDREAIGITYLPVFSVPQLEPMGFLTEPYVTVDGHDLAIDRVTPILEESGLADVVDSGVFGSIRSALDSRPELRSGIFLPVRTDFIVSCSRIEGLAQCFLSLMSANVPLTLLLSEVPAQVPRAKVKAGISSLRRAGIEVYLWRVGAGLASLADILSLGVTGLVVAEDVVQCIESDDSAFSLMVALTSVASSQKLKVIAPGIKTTSVANMLLKMNISGAAGPVFEDPPVSC